jgi:hypothetical protein
MPNIILSMPDAEQQRLKRSAKKHRQSVSQHVLFLLDAYERINERSIGMRRKDARDLNDLTSLSYELRHDPVSKEKKKVKRR